MGDRNEPSFKHQLLYLPEVAVALVATGEEAWTLSCGGLWALCSAVLHVSFLPAPSSHFFLLFLSFPSPCPTQSNYLRRRPVLPDSGPCLKLSPLRKAQGKKTALFQANLIQKRGSERPPLHSRRRFLLFLHESQRNTEIGARPTQTASRQQPQGSPPMQLKSKTCGTLWAGRPSGQPW